MISKLFPRILNKSSDKTAVKPSEFSDALNILVTGDDGGDSNIIKKADGNIESTINDPENFPILGNTGVIKEEVLGRYEDQERNRVYYFTFGEEDGAASISYSSIYLLERISESDYRFILLLRTKSTDDPSVHLGFTREDFIPANIIQTPKLKRESYTDNLNDGSTGDTDSDFDLDDGGGGSPIVAISVLDETLFVAGVQGGDFGEVFDDFDLATPLTTEFGYFIIQNSGNTSAEVAISAQVTNSINGASVVVPSTVTVSPNFQQVVDFDIVLDVAQFQANGGTIGSNGVDVQVSITVQEVVTADALSLTNYNQTFSSEVTFMFPDQLLPISLSVTSPVTSDAVNFPSTSGTATLIPESPFFFPDGIGQYTYFTGIPDNQFASLLGPFTLSFDQWDEPPQGSSVSSYTEMRVEVSFEASQENEQGQADFWEVIDVNDINSITNTTTSTGSTSITITKPGGVMSEADATAPFGGFYIRKAFDTSSWLADPNLESFVFSKVRVQILKENTGGGSSFVGHAVTSPSLSIGLNAGVITSTNPQVNHEIGFFGVIQDAPDPANIQVTNVGWGSNEALFDLEPNVDDGNGANTGSTVIQTITVQNLGNIGGWYYPTCLWAQKSWSSDIESAGSFANALSADYLGLGYSAWSVFRGAYEMTDITYTSPSASEQVKPWSPLVLSDQNPSWVFTESEAGVFGSQELVTTPPPPMFLDGLETGTITITWSNIGSDFQYGAVGASDFSEQDDDEITNTYVGTDGPYYYWGQPDTNTGVTYSFYPGGIPNFEFQLWNVYAKNSPEPPTDLSEFSPVWGSEIQSANGVTAITVDGNFEGPLVITAHKTFRWNPFVSNSGSAPNHPLIANSVMANGWQQGAPNSIVGWSGSNYNGTRPFFLGVYPDSPANSGSQGSFYSLNAQNSGAGVDGFGQTPEFWFKQDGSWNQQKADFLFINTSSNPVSPDVYLEVFIEPFETWFYQTSNNTVSQTLPQGLEVTTEFGMDGASQNVHQPTPQNGGQLGQFPPSANGLGSLGPSMVFSNPIPIGLWAGDTDNVFRGDGTSYNAWSEKFDGSTSYNFPQYNAGNTSPLSFPFYLGGFRNNTIYIPPGHLVVGRVQYNYQNKGSQNPALGMEDIVNQPGVDYDEPDNIYGMPCTIRARWINGVSNPQSTYVTIANVLGLPNTQQLNALFNY